MIKYQNILVEDLQMNFKRKKKAKILKAICICGWCGAGKTKRQAENRFANQEIIIHSLPWQNSSKFLNTEF